MTETSPGTSGPAGQRRGSRRAGDDADGEINDVAIDLSIEDAQELHVRLTGLLLAAGWLALR